jgi:hypothetical protein
MKDTFILGAGFSKAVHPAMPLMQDLSDIVIKKSTIEAELRSARMQPFVESNNFELILSYLFQESTPWKDRSETNLHKSIFYKIANKVREEIMQKESESLDVSIIPDWLQKLVLRFHTSQARVLSFNYDTLIERVARYTKPEGKQDPIMTDWLYPKFLRNVDSFIYQPPGLRIVHVPIEYPTFKLIKLHGSINWYYSGEFNFPGDPVYFVAAHQKNPRYDVKQYAEHLLDKEPLIIPPVTDKAAFYSTSIIRTLWAEAHKALHEADRIFFLGYSLPETDITTRYLLMSAVQPEAKIFIVNRGKTDIEKKKLCDRYQSAMPQVSAPFDLSFIKDGGIEAIADYI